jgi:ketosteroid isomerase-like protein
MQTSKQLVLACLGLFLVYTSVAQEPEATGLIQQVEDTERAFAATMADRDFDAFTTFLSSEAVFFAGEKPLTGKQQIADAWKPFFQEPAAPFSWQPKTVVVLESGALALSSGPVFDPAGKHVGTFNSIWRLDPDGQWRIIFDKGSDVCQEKIQE